MSQTTVLRRLAGVWLTALLALPSAAFSGEELPFSKLSIADAQRDFSATQECVQPEAEMRRNHMKYILHQRDETMHQGVRTRQYSLEECINCHAAKDESGNYIPVEDTRHFCASCHTYASVSIDCFQCHNDVPVRASTLQKPQASSDAGPTGDAVATELAHETQRFLASEDKAQ